MTDQSQDAGSRPRAVLATGQGKRCGACGALLQGASRCIQCGATNTRVARDQPLRGNDAAGAGGDTFGPDAGRVATPLIPVAEQRQAAGSSSPRFCTHCGAGLSAGAAFCESCGTRIAVAAPMPPTQASVVRAQPATYPAGYVAVGAAPTNTLAIVALVLGLTTGLGGIICGHMALSQIRRTGEGGRGLAIGGLVVGYLWLAIIVLYVVVVVMILGAASRSGYDYGMTQPFVAALLT